MIRELRKEITSKLDGTVLERIKNAPKPTKVAEIISVAKEFKNMSLSLEEIAEITNVAEPGRNVKARMKDYPIEELRKHPNLLVTTTPQGCFVRYVGA
jgi:uncharacterized protein with PhoU and TrkA domain